MLTAQPGQTCIQHYGADSRQGLPWSASPGSTPLHHTPQAAELPPWLSVLARGPVWLQSSCMAATHASRACLTWTESALLLAAAAHI